MSREPLTHHEAQAQPWRFSEAHAMASETAPPNNAVSPDKALKIVARSIIARITRNCSAASSRVVMSLLCNTKHVLTSAKIGFRRIVAKEKTSLLRFHDQPGRPVFLRLAAQDAAP
jgi:hypothetical protein